MKQELSGPTEAHGPFIDLAIIMPLYRPHGGILLLLCPYVCTVMARKSAGSQKSAWPERASGVTYHITNKRRVSNERLALISAYIRLL